MKATIVLKKGNNMAGLAKHLAKKYGGDPDFFTKVVGDETLAGYDDDAKKAIAAKAHKLAIGRWPAEDPDNKKKKQVSWKGGPGSGFEGHAGIPGHQGGSQAEGGGHVTRAGGKRRKLPPGVGSSGIDVHGNRTAGSAASHVNEFATKFNTRIPKPDKYGTYTIILAASARGSVGKVLESMGFVRNNDPKNSVGGSWKPFYNSSTKNWVYTSGSKDEVMVAFGNDFHYG